MKVLLLHEMSGVHTELKKALRELGVHADIATLGDFFKKYSTDVYLGPPDPTVKGNFLRAFNQMMLIPKLREYDIVQLISPNPFYKLIQPLLEKIVYHNKKIVYIAAGSDAIYLNYVRELEYFPPHIHFDRWSENERLKHFEKLKSKLSKNCSHIVPLCWEYKEFMRKAGLNPENIIPFPIDITKNIPTKKSNSKIVVFHPLNRIDLNYDFKGTLKIKEVFEKLQTKYPDVEFVTKGNMSHKEYDLFTNNVDIIVDQCNSYSYGMSAAYGLAKGKVVLSSLHQRARNEEFYKDCPVITIKPEIDFIEYELEKLLQDRKSITEISEKSRAFAEEHHDSLKVAQKYLELYKK